MAWLLCSIPSTDSRLIGYRVGRAPAHGERGFDPLLQHRQVTDKSRIGIGELNRPRVSAAIAFVLGSDLAGPDIDREAVLRATNYVIPSLTIVDESGDAPVLILGNPPIAPLGTNLASLAVRLLSNGEEVGGNRGDTTEHPADAVARLATAATGTVALRKGTIVVADVFGSLVPVAPGDRLRADIADLGRASAELTGGNEIVTIGTGNELGTPLGDHARAPLSVGRFDPIYDPADGEREPWCLNDHCFANGPDGRWHLFGITHVKPFNHAVDPGTRLAHATAGTLQQAGWQKEPFALTVDPDGYDEHLLWAPHVVEHDGIFHLFACVGAREGYRYAIHRYESDDLWTWRRTEHGPIVVDGVEGRDPMVLRDGNRWICYYTATERTDGGHFVVAAVLSDDLVTWSNRRVVFTHAREGKFGGPTESPFVVRRGPSNYLFVTDDDTVHVYVSDDLMHWSPGDHVFAYVGHACEVVRDESGAWFISHVGWEQDGLWLAPLTWKDGLDAEPSSIAPARS
jgi:beta-fructofuranosidase